VNDLLMFLDERGRTAIVATTKVCLQYVLPVDPPMAPSLPIPHEALRVGIGPFVDPAEFERSGARMADEIIQLCALARNAQLLELGCGCGRLGRAFARHLSPDGTYEG
jgi:hypothetical protein